jgi:hypothetical protein
VNIARQASAALAAAHKLGITHRDIKPDNILLVENPDGSDTVKVLDFGIAKIREGSPGFGAGYTPTQTGLVVGTPQYLSPEQAMGKHGSEVDGRADLYSIGVVLYEMLTGQLPFHSDTTIGLLMHHIHTVPTPAHYLKPDLNIPPAISLVLMKILEKDPSKRFQTADELVTALSAPQNWAATAVMGSGSFEGPVVASAPARAPEPAPTTPTPVPAAVPAPAASSAVSAAVATPLPAEIPAPEPAKVQTHVLPRPPRRHEINWKRIAIVAGIAVLLAIAVTLVKRPSQVAPAQPNAAELDDTRILNEVDRVLDSSAALRRQEVGVKVENGVVFLDGRVDSKEESDIAENLTYSVVGVNGIKNNILVSGRKNIAKQPGSDAQLIPDLAPENTPSGSADATQQHRINQLLTEGKRRTEIGDYVVARDLFLAVLAIDPNNQTAEQGRRYARRMLIQQRRNAR